MFVAYVVTMQLFMTMRIEKESPMNVTRYMHHTRRWRKWSINIFTMTVPAFFVLIACTLLALFPLRKLKAAMAVLAVFACMSVWAFCNHNSMEVPAQRGQSQQQTQITMARG
ncbi:unnamed protein product [Polarella glacialis]|nr:unnamed protein product [Polarella glacialis]